MYTAAVGSAPQERREKQPKNNYIVIMLTKLKIKWDDNKYIDTDNYVHSNKKFFNSIFLVTGKVEQPDLQTSKVTYHKSFH